MPDAGDVRRLATEVNSGDALVFQRRNIVRQMAERSPCRTMASRTVGMTSRRNAACPVQEQSGDGNNLPARLRQFCLIARSNQRNIASSGGHSSNAFGSRAKLHSLTRCQCSLKSAARGSRSLAWRPVVPVTSAAQSPFALQSSMLRRHPCSIASFQFDP